MMPTLQLRKENEGHWTVRVTWPDGRFERVAGFGLDLFVVMQRHLGPRLAAAAGLIFTALALFFWYVLEWLRKRNDLVDKPMPKHEKTPLHAKVEQMLTEARVLIPGAQALLGF